MDKSMNEKICIAHDLAVGLARPLNEGNFVVDIATNEMIWGHADGLTAKHLYNMRDMRGSIAACIAFDPAEAEAQLDKDIEEMEKLTEEVK